MPNHVTNRVQFLGTPERVEELLERIAAEGFDNRNEPWRSAISFDKIVPMPESLNIEEGSQTAIGLAAVKALNGDTASASIYLSYKWLQEKGVNTIEKFIEHVRQDKRAWDLGEQAYKNIQETGHKTWYDWSINNWGTKWDAYSVHGPDRVEGGQEIVFDTAWSPPTPVMETLSKQFPDITIIMKSFDEGWGFAVTQTFVDGDVEEDDYSDDMESFYEEVYGTPYNNGEEDEEEEEEEVEAE